MRVGIITGSGSYQRPSLTAATSTSVSTRFGDVALTDGKLGDVEVVHLSRHGAGHARLPHQVAHRANLSAARLLEHGHDVAFGPALDEGYHLVALGRPTPEVFGINPALWGTAAREAGLRVAFLSPLRDLDNPEDARVLEVVDSIPAGIRSILSASSDAAAALQSERIAAQSRESA